MPWCRLPARLIDTSTAEILASASGRGESTRKGTGLLGAGGSVYGPEAGAGIDMKSSNFANTIIGEATNKAVTDLAPIGSQGSLAAHQVWCRSAAWWRTPRPMAP